LPPLPAEAAPAQAEADRQTAAPAVTADSPRNEQASETALPPLPADDSQGATRSRLGVRPSASRWVSDDFGKPNSEPLPSRLSPELQREVERIAQRQDELARSRRDQVPATDIEPSISRLELPRAPSATEARPIRPIPVPEEFVPLGPRQWNPTRKYWAAAATCHGPLYFQDAVLERYGQSVEQALGPAGRFFTYPLDDPKESKQRNNILQPFYGLGLFYTQIVALPYNLVVDPPWEAEYDLGYYRPGDRIVPDTYFLPTTGIGPPLQGKRY
jgi:hypothetical protein